MMQVSQFSWTSGSLIMQPSPMNAKRWHVNRGYLLMLIVCTPLLALADGMVIPQRAYSIPQIPDQQALIHYANGTETLVIETSFAGPGTNFAWIVPLPAVPTIESVSPGLFPTLQVIFQPEVVLSVKHYWIALPVAVLLILILLLIRREPAFGVLVLGLLFILFLILAPMFSRAHSRGSSSGANVGRVEVVRRQNAGLFETVILRSKDAPALLDWLNQNGYLAPTNIAPVIADYLREGWVFAAARLNRDRDEPSPQATHPLAFVFKTARPVYPLRLTAKGTASCRIDLYVFGPGRAKALDFDVKRCEAPNYGPADGWPRFVAGELRVRHTELAKLVARAPVATKLSGSLDAAQMSHDLYVEWTAYWPSGSKLYSNDAALTFSGNIAAISFMALVLVWWILSKSKSAFTRRIPQIGYCLAPVALATTIAVYFLGLPKIGESLTRVGRFWPDLVINDTMRLAMSLGEEVTEPGLVSNIISKAATPAQCLSSGELEQLLETLSRDLPPNYYGSRYSSHPLTNAFTGERIRFEASPGNFILRPSSHRYRIVNNSAWTDPAGPYELVWHDLDAAEAITNSVP